MDEFASHTNIVWQGNTGIVEYGGGDRGMVCMFYNRAVHNAAKSAQSGRPFYEDKIFVRIHPPGERLNIVDREATDTDRKRFPAQWQQFRQNKQQQPEGTPIELLYPDYPSVPAMLRASGVQTIEQCADLSATAIDGIGMGAQRYVNAAKKYLEAAAKGGATTQMRHELEERDREIKVLKKQVADMKEQLQQLQTPQPMDMAQIQAMLAGMMGRPQFPTTPQPSQQFDAQTALINATSPTAQATQARKGRTRRPRIT